jgi:sarcosine oxidase subunit alpha
VEGAIVVQLDKDWQPVDGSQEDIPCDTVCLGVGLTPSARLLFQAGVKHQYVDEAGGHVAIHNAVMRTSVAGIYVAGDGSGIEEASTAMMEGNIAGLSAALDIHPHSEGKQLLDAYQTALQAMREGPFGRKARAAKEIILQEASHEGL